MVKNIEVKEEIKEMLYTLVEASFELKRTLERDNTELFSRITGDMMQLCMVVEQYATDKIGEYYNEFYKSVENIKYSLMNIINELKEDKNKTIHKIEFELIPLCRVAYIYFYYKTIIEPQEDIREEWLITEGLEINKNEYIEEYKKDGNYKYDLSIIVQGYNKLDYTKQCIKALMDNLPKEISFELIFVNNGSNDGTKEFFESAVPTKQIDIKCNGIGALTQFFVYEGKYQVFISNDVIVTPNALNIIYEAFENDNRIGMAVPITANISNLQSPRVNGVDINYKSLNELNQVVGKYNKCESKLEEVRYRLCTPIYGMRNEFIDEVAIYWLKFSDITMFSDDMLSLFWRRKGYKNVLMKDIYCHHFGSVTLRDNKLTANKYNEGRKLYLDLWGVDPWGKGFCWNYALFSKLECNNKNATKIVGINCGMGSNPLKIQQELKEKVNNTDAKIINFTKRKRYADDVKDLSDIVYLYNNWSEIEDRLDDIYDYIIVDEFDEKESYKSNIRSLRSKLTKDGKLIIFVNEKQDIDKWIKSEYGDNNVEETEKTDIIYEIDDIIASDMPRQGKYVIISNE